MPFYFSLVHLFSRSFIHSFMPLFVQALICFCFVFLLLILKVHYFIHKICFDGSAPFKNDATYMKQYILIVIWLKYKLIIISFFAFFILHMMTSMTTPKENIIRKQSLVLNEWNNIHCKKTVKCNGHWRCFFFSNTYIQCNAFSIVQTRNFLVRKS